MSPDRSAASSGLPASDAADSRVFQGRNVVAAPADRVWQMLQDPVVLARVIPGLSDVERVGEGEFRGKLILNAGPVHGTFKTTLNISDESASGTPPDTMRAQVEGRNLTGTARLDVQLTFTDLGEGCRVDWLATPQLSGLLSRLGGGLVERKAAEEGAGQRYGDQFFSRLSQEA